MNGGVWHLFGTGHSHFIGEEVYYRAGGLVPVNAILFPALMQHEGPVTSTRRPASARTPLTAAPCSSGRFDVINSSGWDQCLRPSRR